MKQPEVISIESDAFIRLIEQVVNHVRKMQVQPACNRWISVGEAKVMLGISSNSTLQKLRDNAMVRFSQPAHKIILYDRQSIEDYLEQHARNTF